MNKKLLLGAAILSIFGSTLTSCVDSTESASVTTVREAKAEQLKSIAKLNDALAEKELIIANAQKAAQAAEQAYMEAQAQKLVADAEYQKSQAILLEAQAEREKAYAEYLQAQAEYEKAKAEYEKAQANSLAAQDANALERLKMEQERLKMEQDRLAMELKERDKQLEVVQANLDRMAQDLEQAKENLQEQKDRWAITLQQLNYQLEQTKLDVLTAQHYYDVMMENYQKEKDDAAKQEILLAAQNVKNKINAYNTAAQNLVYAQTSLEEAKLYLARLQSNLESQKNVISENIASLQESNTDLQNQINEQQVIIDAYTKYAGTEITPEMVADANLEVVKTQVAYDEQRPEVDAAAEAVNEGSNALWGGKYYELFANLTGNSYGYYSVENKTMERYDTYVYQILAPWLLTQSEIPAECRDKYVLRIQHWVSGTNEDGTWKGENITTYTPVFDNFTEGVAELENGEEYSIYDTFYNLLNDGAGLQAWLTCKLNTLKEQLTDVDALNKELTNAKNLLAQYNQKLTAAKTTYTNAVNATKTAEGKKDAAYATYEQKSQAESDAWNAYNDAWNNYWQTEQTEEDRQVVEDALTAAQAAQAAASEAWTKYDEANTAYWDAYYAENDAYWAKENAKSCVDYATALIEAITVDIRRAESGNADNAEQVAFYTDLVNEIIAEAKVNVENITAYNDALKAHKEAVNKSTELYQAYDEALTNRNVLSDCVYNNFNMEGGNWTANSEVYRATQQIAWLKQQMEWNEQSIESLKQQLAEIGADSDYDYQQNIINAQARIDRAQYDYNTCKQLYDIAKAELDAALEASK